MSKYLEPNKSQLKITFIQYLGGSKPQPLAKHQSLNTPKTQYITPFISWKHWPCFTLKTATFEQKLIQSTKGFIILMLWGRNIGTEKPSLSSLHLFQFPLLANCRGKFQTWSSMCIFCIFVNLILISLLLNHHLTLFITHLEF